MSSLSTGEIWAVAAALGIALYGVYRTTENRNWERLPPGPPCDPFVGNLRHIPRGNQKKVFAEWRKIYGNVIYLGFLGNSILVLNSERAARDLLEVRSSNYSCRPRFVLIEEMMGWKSLLSQLPYGDKFRKQRQLMQEYFHPRVLPNYYSLIEQEVAIFVEELAEMPEKFRTHIKRLAAGTVMKVAYGHTVTSLDDIYVQTTQRAFLRTAQVVNSGGAIVDFFPILKYIPAWFPGAKFKRDALSAKADVRAHFDIPFNAVKEQLKTGNVSSSFTADLMELLTTDGAISAEDEDDIKSLSGMIFSAAADTTVAVLATFILAMVLYPDVLAKAQTELDRVIGSHRLPDFSDKNTLPYLDAIITETFRWNPPAPFGVPHRAMRDDIYNGYHIPRNSTVIANIWAMTMDPETFVDPHEFNPERFLNNKGKDLPNPRELIFGFGRCLCPGKQFAEANIWLATATVVAALQMEKARDDAGNVITPKAAFTTNMNTLSSQPESFDCVIKPRSDKASVLIHQTRANRHH